MDIKPGINPRANHRLKVNKLAPQGEYCLMRFDPEPKKTKGGLLLPKPSETMNGRFGSTQPAAEETGYHKTGVVLAVGPDAPSYVTVGKRFVFTDMVMLLTVADEEEQLGMLDARDLHLEVI